MARIRSIHPGLWTDEAFVTVSRDARLLFVGILTECDDKGTFEWKPLQIKMRLCAGDDVGILIITEWLEELSTANVLRRYEIGGVSYGAVRNFQEWQRPKKPNDIYPIPDQFRNWVGPKGMSSELPPILTNENTELPPPIIIVSPEPVPNQFPTGGENSPQMERREEEERIIPPIPPLPERKRRRTRTLADYPELGEFWAPYPRKAEGPAACLPAWIAARERASLAEILDGLTRYPFHPDPTKQPQATTWLNQSRWMTQANTSVPNGELTLRQMPITAANPLGHKLSTNRSDW